MQKNIEKVCIKYGSKVNTQLDFSMSKNVGLGEELGTFLNRVKLKFDFNFNNPKSGRKDILLPKLKQMNSIGLKFYV